MKYPTLAEARLADVDDSFYYAATCNSCCRKKRISLLKLRSSLGEGYPLLDVRSHLRCSTCHSKNIIVSYYTPAHAETSLGTLFKEPFSS